MRSYARAARCSSGFATMAKLHALALLLPLVVAALWRPPAGGWNELWARARARPAVLAAFVVPWVVIALFLNGVLVPFTPTG